MLKNKEIGKNNANKTNDKYRMRTPKIGNLLSHLVNEV